MRKGWQNERAGEIRGGELRKRDDSGQRKGRWEEEAVNEMGVGRRVSQRFPPPTFLCFLFPLPFGYLERSGAVTGAGKSKSRDYDADRL